MKQHNFCRTFMAQWTKKGFIGESFSFVVVYLVVGGLTKTLIVPAVFLYLKMIYIVRITRISAFHGYMICSAFSFFSFCV